jgi:23S rRNA pseudouridine2605 synthase
VTRLIRLSFGPFQLGLLAAGAIEEVPTKVLQEQLGARLAGGQPPRNRRMAR